MTETFTERPAIGTRVKLEGWPGLWHHRVEDQCGEVIQLGHSWVWVRFDNGVEDYGEWRYLRPETPTAPDQAAPTHIVIEGTRYKLTPETEAPAEENKEPEVGEVWEVLGELVLVTEDYNVRLHNGRMGGYDHERIKDLGTFVAASLEEGIRGGFITADNLRYHAPRH